METLLPLLALGFAASALLRLARMRFAGRTLRVWTRPAGPNGMLALLEMLSALFLIIPNTLIWGLFLSVVIAGSYMIALWKLRLSRS